jgi:hypothetical protein
VSISKLVDFEATIFETDDFKATMLARLTNPGQRLQPHAAGCSY